MVHGNEVPSGCSTLLIQGGKEFWSILPSSSKSRFLGIEFCHLLRESPLRLSHGKGALWELGNFTISKP